MRQRLAARSRDVTTAGFAILAHCVVYPNANHAPGPDQPRGPGVQAVHERFDTVSEEVEGYSDALAERAGALGGTAQGTLPVVTERTFLLLYPLGIADVQPHQEHR